MASVKTQIRALIEQGIARLRADGLVPADPSSTGAVQPDFVVERPKDRSHGDFSTNAAMLLAKAAKSNPRAIAQALLPLIQAADSRGLLAAVEIAGPGFLNFRLAPAAWQQQLRDIHAQGADYGRNESGRDASGRARRAGVEYVSANPTGPLHVGHGRAAVIGDCIARVLAANGWDVVREFYYNDAGAQIDNLAKSVQARALGKDARRRGLAGGRLSRRLHRRRRQRLPARRQRLLREATRSPARATPPTSTRSAPSPWPTCAASRTRTWPRTASSFDVYFLESSLYADDKVEETVRELVAHGHTYEEGGALWLRTTDFGDDKDRVMRKSDGTYTYFVPDIAYHLSKWQRGYERAITELGADHHGSLKRVHAGLQALDAGIPPGWPEYVLHQMVTVMRGGEEVKLSKRAGSYLTLRDLVEEAGRDATRWFLLARKPDSQLTFDIDLARAQSLDNPVYYVQLSHARICGLWRQLKERGLAFDAATGCRSRWISKTPATRTPAGRAVALPGSRRGGRRAPGAAPADGVPA